MQETMPTTEHGHNVNKDNEDNDEDEDNEEDEEDRVWRMNMGMMKTTMMRTMTKVNNEQWRGRDWDHYHDRDHDRQ
jgi:hypothetical protein